MELFRQLDETENKPIKGLTGTMPKIEKPERD